MLTLFNAPAFSLHGFALAVVLITVSAQTASPAATEPFQSIEWLDVSRYLGTWYEIAKNPNRF